MSFGSSFFLLSPLFPHGEKVPPVREPGGFFGTREQVPGPIFFAIVTFSAASIEGRAVVPGFNGTRGEGGSTGV